MKELLEAQLFSFHLFLLLPTFTTLLSLLDCVHPFPWLSPLVKRGQLIILQHWLVMVLQLLFLMLPTTLLSIGTPRREFKILWKGEMSPRFLQQKP